MLARSEFWTIPYAPFGIFCTHAFPGKEKRFSWIKSTRVSRHLLIFLSLVPDLNPGKFFPSLSPFPMYLAVILLAPRFLFYFACSIFFSVYCMCVCLYNFSPPNFFTGQRFLCPPPVRPKAREMTKPELKRGVH